MNSGIGCPHGRDKRGHLAGVLDTFCGFDTTADVDGKRPNAYDTVSGVVYVQATTQNDPRRELFWDERPIEDLSCAAISVHVGVKQKA